LPLKILNLKTFENITDITIEIIKPINKDSKVNFQVNPIQKRIEMKRIDRKLLTIIS
jgi:hypothetical protein